MKYTDNSKLHQTKRKCAECDLFSLEVYESKRFELNLCPTCLTNKLLQEVIDRSNKN